ncbi:hypothetical protein F985_03888 [Acinetobacter seifertii]|uniref:Uncharacterized protein n=1 Tax=Acinetobacter seifertii TaxID=1530123 RepID=N8SB51_9GAMM|nr:hypothetical protein F985_03888 [Acinetobacter seifertii]
MINKIQFLSTDQYMKNWEQTYIEFLVKLSKPIKDDLPVGWCVWMIG